MVWVSQMPSEACRTGELIKPESPQARSAATGAFRFFGLITFWFPSTLSPQLRGLEGSFSGELGRELGFGERPRCPSASAKRTCSSFSQCSSPRTARVSWPEGRPDLGQGLATTVRRESLGCRIQDLGNCADAWPLAFAGMWHAC